MPRPGWTAVLASVWMILAAASQFAAAAPAPDGDALMQGAPPAADQRVTRGNWLQPPYNRWGLQHLEQIAPVATVDRGEEPQTALGPLWLDLQKFQFTGPDGNRLQLIEHYGEH